MSHPHPDFELYDNIDRAPDQVTAASAVTATRYDLRRWSLRDAEEFLARHPLPSAPLPRLDPGPYVAALAAAEKPAEVSAVTQHLLDAVYPTVRELSNLLVDIARWEGRHRSAAPDSAPKMLMSAASRCLDALALADQADMRVLRDEYDPAPQPPPPRPQPAQGLPPSPPGSAQASAPHRPTTRHTP